MILIIPAKASLPPYVVKVAKFIEIVGDCFEVFLKFEFVYWIYIRNFEVIGAYNILLAEKIKLLEVRK